MPRLNGWLLALVFGLSLCFGCNTTTAPEVETVELRAPEPEPRSFPNGLPFISAASQIVAEVRAAQMVVVNDGRFIWRFNVGGAWYNFHYWDESQVEGASRVRFINPLTVIVWIAETFYTGENYGWDESHYYPQNGDNGFMFVMRWDDTKFAAIGWAADQEGCWHQPINLYRDCEEL